MVWAPWLRDPLSYPWPGVRGAFRGNSSRIEGGEGFPRSHLQRHAPFRLSEGLRCQTPKPTTQELAAARKPDADRAKYIAAKNALKEAQTGFVGPHFSVHVRERERERDTEKRERDTERETETERERARERDNAVYLHSHDVLLANAGGEMPGSEHPVISSACHNL